MDDNKLLGLQRAEFKRAEAMGARGSKVQFLIVIISIITVFINNSSYAYALSILNLIIAVLWLWLNMQAKNSHSIAERARRAVVFSNGLGVKISGKSYTDLKMLFNVHESAGEKYEDEMYFKTQKEYGNQKLAEIVEESSFWSKHLFKKSAKRYWLYFSATLVISILGLLLLPLLNVGSLDILISQVFSLILIWLITGNIFASAMSFTNAANAADDIEARLDKMALNMESNQDVLLIVSDYNALVESSPTIPSDLYGKNRERLNSLWKDRLRD
jgi:hypothetical protein